MPGHPLLNAIVLALGLLLVPRAWAERAFRGLMNPWVSAFVLAGYAGLVGHYVMSLQFMDHLEATVASLSWALTQGKPLYHDVEATGRHAILYGPHLYLATLVPLKVLGPSIPALKVGAAFASLSSLALLYLAMAGRLPSRARRLSIVALVALAYMGVSGASYWIRSEPWMLLFTSLSLLVVSSFPPSRAVYFWGVSAGIMAGMKLHAVIYLLPALALLSVRGGWRGLAGGAMASLAAFAVPFLVQPDLFSFERMLFWIRSTSRHGVSLLEGLSILEWGLFYLALTLPWLSKRKLEENLYLAALALSLLLACGAGSLKGAGRYHLLPWVPSLAFGAAMLMRYPARQERFARALTMACVLSLGVIGFKRGIEDLARHDRRPGARIVAELEAIQKDYPGKTIEMGYGMDYELSFYRPLLVFPQGRFLLDGAALMDMQPYGIAVSEGTFQRVANCDPDLWLFPKGEEPLDLRHLAPPHARIFPEEFRRAFMDRFKLKESREFYSVWSCT